MRFGSVKTYLFVMLGAITFLALVFGYLLLRQAETDHLRIVADQLAISSKAIGAAVDLQLARYQSILDLLSRSSSLAAGDLVKFESQVRSVPDSNTVWVSLADTNGNQLVNTKLPTGQTAPAFIVTPELQAALDRNETFISDVSTSALTGKPILYLSRKAANKYIITIVIDPLMFAESLAIKRIAPEGTIAIVDRKGIIAARNRTPERFVGTPATDDVAKMIASKQEGVLESVTKDGIPVLTSCNRAVCGWTAIVAVPRDQVLSITRDLMRQGLILAAILVLLAFGFALSLGRSVIKGVNSLVKQSELLASGELKPGVSTGLSETDLVCSAMQKAAAQLKSREEERHLAEERLRSSEERLRLITSNIPVLIGYIDVSLKYQFLNDPYLDWTGLTPEQVLNRTITEVFGHDFYAANKHYIEMALAGKTVCFERITYHKSMGGRVTEVHYIPDFRNTAKVHGFYVFIYDIHERKQIEENLRKAKEAAERSQAEQQAIVTSMAEGVAIFDANGTLKFMNPAALEMHGFSDLDGMQKQLSSIQHVFHITHLSGEDLPLEQWPISRCLRGEHFRSYEVRVTGPSKSRHWIGSYSGAPVLDANGKVVLAIITVRDVTEQRQAEQAVRAARAELAQANAELEKTVEERTRQLRETIEELEAFSYSIAHDMRAPLRTMRSFSDLLYADHSQSLNEEGRDFLKRISVSAERLDRLLLDVLQLSRFAREEIPLAPLDAHTLLESLLDTYPNFQQHRQNIHLQGRLPAVLGNEAALTQCFSNLISNALKFIQPGTTPEILIWSTIQNGTATIYFKDNGIGIPAESQSRIFRMFEQLTRSADGTGVGLAIVKRAIEKMGGEVGVQSDRGLGSTFWITLKTAQLIA